MLEEKHWFVLEEKHWWVESSHSRKRIRGTHTLSLPFYFFLQLICVSVCWYVFEISIGLFVI